jgi:hypothetical protein
MQKCVLDYAFLISETFLASIIYGPEGPWRAKGVYFPDKSSSAPGTEDKNSGRDCSYAAISQEELEKAIV